MSFAPITIFAYNRPELLKQTVDALKQNLIADQSDLFIYADGSKNSDDLDAVKKVRAYIKTISGFKSVTIFEREKNYGLSVSIIDGVTNIVNKFGKIVVLEDDLITSPYFLKFINDALNMYENDEQVISVQGYVYPSQIELPDYFFIKGADCQGWATWKRGWDLFEKDGSKLLKGLKNKRLYKEFNFDNTYPYVKMLKNQIKGKVGSWAIRWYASAFLNNRFTLYPGKTMIYNIGFDSNGTNTNNKEYADIFNSEINTIYPNLKKILIAENDNSREAFKTFFKSFSPKLLIRIKNKMIRMKNFIFQK